MESRKYKIKYKMEFGEFTAEELKKEKDIGACDEILVCSKLAIKDGAASYLFLHRKGHKDVEMDATDLFKIWSMLSAEILQRDDVINWHREILAESFDKVRKKITGKTDIQKVKNEQLN